MELITFNKALSLAKGKRHLMLGNGFSMALFPKIFSYGSLFSRADFTSFSEVPATFDAIQSNDFEAAVQALENAALVLPCFHQDAEVLCARMKACAVKIKETLVDTIANQHPDMPGAVTAKQYESCLNFLKIFLGGENKGKVYTLNYDILLYWTIMHALEIGMLQHTECNDGFYSDIFGQDDDYVVWEPSSYEQNIYYLHGALHLFDGGTELRKYTWSRTGIRLMDQTRTAISAGLFPLFVAEGSAEKKMSKIQHHAYLSKGLDSLGRITGSLFVHGLAFSDNDVHILKKIAKNLSIENLFVSIYGAPESEGVQKIVQATEKLREWREGICLSQKKPARQNKLLTVNFYDSASANVWGAA